jgi:hypothetical protein
MLRRQDVSFTTSRYRDVLDHVDIDARMRDCDGYIFVVAKRKMR